MNIYNVSVITHSSLERVLEIWNRKFGFGLLNPEP